MYLCCQRYFFAALMGCLPCAAIAQTHAYDPSNYPKLDAGALMRQVEQSIRAGSSTPSVNRLIPIEPPLTLAPNASLRVNSFRFVNANLLPEDQLQAVVAPFAHRELTSSDLDNLCSVVVNAYRQVGWVVRVYIPRQAVVTDQLTVQVLETIPPPSPQ